MRLSFGQELRQEQKQILTQRMIQSMEILQLSLLQLEQRIDLEMEQNPLLDLDSDDSLDNTDADADSTERDGGSEELAPETVFEFEPEITVNPFSDQRDDFQIADDFASTYADTIDELPARSQNWLEEQDHRRSDAFANIAMPEQTLQDYLLGQLGWFDLSESLRAMAERIINDLAPNGYFPYDWGDFLGETSSLEEMVLAQEALALVKKLDPRGVGAKNLKECLLLQIDDTIFHADILATLIRSHLEDISSNRLPHIARVTGFEMSDIQDAISELRHLKPRPGAEFSGRTAATIIPDVIVEKDDGGKYSVRLEEGRSRNLHVNDYYRDMSKSRSTDKGTRDYIKQKIGSAQWLIEAVAQRRATLLKVSQAVVDYQIDFFTSGPHAIKPLKMQQIADTVGVHVTTVSRACDEKWLLTPQGVYPFKRFFSGGFVSSDGSEEISQDSVRIKLREIVDGEDKSKPYSDEQIVRILEDMGIKVARRTVAQYRDMLKIPSSRCRKAWRA